MFVDICFIKINRKAIFMKKTRKITALSLSIAALACAFAFCVCAQECPTQARIHTNDGMSKMASSYDALTVDESYIYISNATQLAELMNAPSMWSGNYMLTSDIDLSWYNGNLPQSPIGNATNKFKGIFDGNGKSIKGIDITASGAVGLFGVIAEEACVKNVNLHGSVTNTYDPENSDTLVDGGIYASTGGLVGSILGGTVENCRVYMTINGKANVGGAVGMIYLQSGSKASAVLKKVFGYSSIGSTLGNIGGLIGRITALGQDDCGVIIDSCVNCSDVHSTSEDKCKVGGVVGYVGAESQKVVIKNCVNHGEVFGKNAHKNATHNADVGGICGLVELETGERAGIDIFKCQNNGNITSNYRAGGIVGRVFRADVCNVPCSIYSCENRASVVGIFTGNVARCEIGGIAGYIQNNNTDINFQLYDCASYASVECDGKSYTGGIIGAVGATDVTGCVSYGICTTDTGYSGGIVGAAMSKGRYTVKYCYVLEASSECVAGYPREDVCTYISNSIVAEEDKANQSIFFGLDFSNVWTVRDGCVAIRAIAVSVYGDIDADGTLTSTDIALIIRYLSGWNVAGAKSLCDITGDGKINNRDVIALIRQICSVV